MSPRIYNSVQISRPIGQVFDFVTTPENWPRWHPASVSVRGNADHSLLAGEEVTETICVLGYRGEAKWLVRERGAPHRWVISGNGENGGAATITYTLIPYSEGTTFERELVYTMPNALFVLFDCLILRRRMKRDSAEALQRLKRLLESGGKIN